MKGMVKAMGHPVHAMVSDFPMVLLLSWVGLDSAGLLLPSAVAWSLGRWALIGGLVAAAGAATVGFVDYLAVAQARPRAAKTATAHMLLNLTAVSVALGVLLFRPAVPSSGMARALQLAAMGTVAVALLAGGWFGGHLVFHHGVGVERGPAGE